MVYLNLVIIEIYPLVIHHQEVDLEIKATCARPTLFFKTSKEVHLIGLPGIYVLDYFHCVNITLFALTDASLNKFESRSISMDKTKLSGVSILSTIHGKTIHQWPYLSQIKSLEPNSAFSDFWSSRENNSWLLNLRPDISFFLCIILCSSNRTLFFPEYIKFHNRVITHLNK